MSSKCCENVPQLLPRFGSMSLMGIDVQTLQRFVTELSATGSRKSVLNLLGTMNAITAYAKRCGIRVLEIPEGSLALSGDRDGAEAVYFKHADVQRIIAIAREPYRTMFILASVTGFRAGELLGLTVADIDFERLMICPRKQADDRTRVLRELKTKKSRTPVPITQQTATILRTYLEHRWVPNPQDRPPFFSSSVLAHHMGSFSRRVFSLAAADCFQQVPV